MSEAAKPSATNENENPGALPSVRKHVGWIATAAGLGIVLTALAAYIVGATCEASSAKLCETIAENPPWLVLSSLAAAPSLLLTWYWRDRGRRTAELQKDKELATAAQKADDDRARNHEQTLQANRTHLLEVRAKMAGTFKAAAELLSGSPEAQIAGVQSMWDIARVSKPRRKMIFRTLAAFVRTKCGSSPSGGVRPYPAVQLALQVLGEPTWQTKWSIREGADLSNTYLANYSFAHGDFRGANFEASVLECADFRNAVLSAARFRRAQCNLATFAGSEIQGADFSSANLDATNFRKCAMATANFEGASSRQWTT